MKVTVIKHATLIDGLQDDPIRSRIIRTEASIREISRRLRT